MFIKLVFEFFDFTSGDFGCDLEVVLVLLLFTEVLALLIIHLGHQLDELTVIQQTVLSQLLCMLYLRLYFLSIVLFLPLQLILQLANLLQVVVPLSKSIQQPLLQLPHPCL